MCVCVCECCPLLVLSLSAPAAPALPCGRSRLSRGCGSWSPAGAALSFQRTELLLGWSVCQLAEFNRGCLVAKTSRNRRPHTSTSQAPPPHQPLQRCHRRSCCMLHERGRASGREQRGQQRVDVRGSISSNGTWVRFHIRKFDDEAAASSKRQKAAN